MSKRKQSFSSTTNSNKNNAFGSFYRNTNFNFRPNSMQDDRGGTRPIAAPSSVSLVLVTMIVHICKKSLLYDPRLKAVIYFGIIFIGSIIADFLPIPKTYFSRSNNILNSFFIKWAWGWLLTTTLPWIILTAYTIGCGRRSLILKHLLRLVFATIAWIIWMKVFHYFETNYGRCLNTRDSLLQVKSKCLQAGNFWSSIDISGHAFIIIYSNLIFSEEGYSLLGWEGIKDFIMNEEYNRISNEISSGYLRNLSDKDLNFLKKSHQILTPYLRGLFIIMTIQQIIWDVMLIATVLYYHTMIEKFIGGVSAILTWYVSYYWLFTFSQLGLLLPAEGIFKYNELKKKQDNTAKSKHTINKASTFMGMPLRQEKEEIEKNNSNYKDTEINLPYKRS